MAVALWAAEERPNNSRRPLSVDFRPLGRKSLCGTAGLYTPTTKIEIRNLNGKIIEINPTNHDRVGCSLSIVLAISIGTMGFFPRVEIQRIGTKCPASTDFRQTRPIKQSLNKSFEIYAASEYLNDDVSFQRLWWIETFDNCVRSRVFNGGAAKLDRFLEHADDKVAIKEVFARLRVH